MCERERERERVCVCVGGRERVWVYTGQEYSYYVSGTKCDYLPLSMNILRSHCEYYMREGTTPTFLGDHMMLTVF